MKTFRTTISVFIMILCGAIGIYFGGYFNDAIGGCILGVPEQDLVRPEFSPIALHG